MSSRSVNHRSIHTLMVGGYKFTGVSVAGLETCICIPSLSLAFDSGRSPACSIPMQHMAITHGHLDHVYGLPLHRGTRSMQKLAPPTYYMPPQIVPDVRMLLDAVGRLEHTQLQSNLIGLEPLHSEVEFKKGWFLKSFPTHHPVPSQGYVVKRRKKKLKPEYHGVDSKELARLRKSGVELDDEVRSVEIAFTGDTTVSAIAESEDCRQARVLITEMTYVNNTCDAERAHKFGHIHINDIIEQAHVFERNEHVIFSHFSPRHSKQEVLEGLNRLPESLRAKSIAFGFSQDSTD